MLVNNSIMVMRFVELLSMCMGNMKEHLYGLKMLLMRLLRYECFYNDIYVSKCLQKNLFLSLYPNHVLLYLSAHSFYGIVHC
jgi:hypothetical protein